MPLPQPIPGLVLSYAYLWRDEHRRGQEEGVKDRPCVIVAVAVADGGTLVSVVPVTHRPPTHLEHGVEIPAATKSRLGLDAQRSWIIVTELNRFRWPGPDLRLLPPSTAGRFDYGVLPPGLFRQVRDGIIAAASRKELAATSRDISKQHRP